MAEFIALKVRIGLHAHGSAKYPEFGSLPIIKESGADWSNWIDSHGSGWLYSKCGHKDHEDDSPCGEQWGLLLVPAEFAEQAVAADPDCCSIITDAEASEFYECKCCRDMPEVRHDADTLNAISAEINLLTLLRETTTGEAQVKHAALLEAAVERAKLAVDPDHAAPGIKKNLDKCWDTFKAKRGFAVK